MIYLKNCFNMINSARIHKFKRGYIEEIFKFQVTVLKLGDLFGFKSLE